MQIIQISNNVQVLCMVLICLAAANRLKADVTIGFTQTSLSVPENVGQVKVCVFKQGRVALPLIVTLNITQKPNSLVAPSNVLISDGNQQVCFNLTIQDNSVLEYNKTAHLALTTNDPQVILWEKKKDLTVTILNDDLVTIQFENDKLNVKENIDGGKVDLVLIMEGVTTVPFDVRLMVNPDKTDTAEEGKDFAIMAKNIIFTHGKQRVRIHVYIKDDELIEEMENFSVKIIIPDKTRAFVGKRSTAVIKLEDSADVVKGRVVDGQQVENNQQSDGNADWVAEYKQKKNGS